MGASSPLDDGPPIELTDEVNDWVKLLGETAYLASLFYEWLKTYDLPEALRHELVARWEVIYLAPHQEEE